MARTGQPRAVVLVMQGLVGKGRSEAGRSTHLLIQPALQLHHLDLHALVQLLVVLH